MKLFDTLLEPSRLQRDRDDFAKPRQTGDSEGATFEELL
jgi:hypothetical protein